MSPSALLLLLGTVTISDEHRDSFSLQLDARVFCASKANLDCLTEEDYAKLLSWRTLEHLLGLLPPDRRSTNVLTPTDKFLGLPGNFPKAITLAVDSHFHLDKLTANTKLSNLQDILKVLSPRKTPYVLVYAVANYCYPEHWGQLPPGPEDDRLYFSVGFHPRRADSDSDFPQLFERARLLLSHQRAVAVGEIGLDYHPSLTSRTLARQRHIFRRMVQPAFALRKPIIVHCRGYDRPDAERDCLVVLKEELPRLYPIHRHCFCGTVEDLHNWRQAFPNSIFGVCSSVCRRSYGALAKHLPLSSTMLESDAPYLPPPGVKTSTPHHLQPTAELVAAARGLSTQEVFHQTAATAVRFYRLGLAEALQ